MIIQSWKNAQVALAGVDHINKGTPCQDKVSFCTGNGIQSIALADGAGSRSMSEEGARISVNTITAFLVKHFYELLMLCEKTGKTAKQFNNDIGTAKDSIINVILEAIKRNIISNKAIDDYACTLQAFAMSEDRYFCCHIGDGLTGILFNGDENIQILSEPENGGAPNITFFITDANAKDLLRINVGKMDDVVGVIQMSDGPGEVLYDKSFGLHANASKIVHNFHGIGVKDYENVLYSLLTETIAKHSYDDLSFNLLYCENTDTNNVSEKYKNEMLSTIKSKKQIIRMSENAIRIRQVFHSDIDFTNANEVMIYLKGLL